jgi:hypothetical protein
LGGPPSGRANHPRHSRLNRLTTDLEQARRPWAGKLRDNRNIGDFRRWKEHDAYQKALERVLRHLKVAQAGP